MGKGSGQTRKKAAETRGEPEGEAELIELRTETPSDEEIRDIELTILKDAAIRAEELGVDIAIVLEGLDAQDRLQLEEEVEAIATSTSRDKDEVRREVYRERGYDRALEMRGQIREEFVREKPKRRVSVVSNVVELPTAGTNEQLTPLPAPGPEDDPGPSGGEEEPGIKPPPMADYARFKVWVEELFNVHEAAAAEREARLSRQGAKAAALEEVTGHAEALRQAFDRECSVSDADEVWAAILSPEPEGEEIAALSVGGRKLGRDSDAFRALKGGMEQVNRIRNDYIVAGLTAGRSPTEQRDELLDKLSGTRLAELEAVPDDRIADFLSNLGDDELLALSPFSPLEIAADLFEPMLRQGLIPENLIPNEYSLVQRTIDGALEAYNKRVEEVAKSRKEKGQVYKDVVGQVTTLSTNMLLSGWGAMQMTAAGLTFAETGSLTEAHLAQSESEAVARSSDAAQKMYLATYVPFGVQVGYEKWTKQHWGLATAEMSAALYGIARIVTDNPDDFGTIVVIHRAFMTAASGFEAAEETFRKNPGRAFEALGRTLHHAIYALEKSKLQENTDKDLFLLTDPDHDNQREKAPVPFRAEPTLAVMVAEACEVACRIGGVVFEKKIKSGKFGIDTFAAFRAAGKTAGSLLRIYAREAVGSLLSRDGDFVQEKLSESELQQVEEKRQDLERLKAIDEPSDAALAEIDQLEMEIASLTGDIDALRKEIDRVIDDQKTDIGYDTYISGVNNLGWLTQSLGRKYQMDEADLQKIAEGGVVRGNPDPSIAEAMEHRALEALEEDMRQQLQAADDDVQQLLVTGFSMPRDDRERAAFDMAKRASSIEGLAERARKAEMDVKMAKMALKMVGGFGAAMNPGGLGLMAAANMCASFQDSLRFLNEFRKWQAIHKEGSKSDSLAAEAIANRYACTKRAMIQQSINTLLYAIEAIGETMNGLFLGSDAGAGLVTAGASRAVKGIMDIALQVHDLNDMRKAWADFEHAMKNPHDRERARRAIRRNPTLSKYALAYGAVEGKDPFARKALRICGINETTLADPKTNALAVEKYLESVFYDDPVLEAKPWPTDTKTWCPLTPDLKATTWARITAAAQDPANFALFTGLKAKGRSETDKKGHMAAEFAYGGAIAGGLAVYETEFAIRQDDLRERLATLEAKKHAAAEAITRVNRAVGRDLTRAPGGDAAGRIEQLRTAAQAAIEAYEKDYAGIDSDLAKARNGLKQAWNGLEKSTALDHNGAKCPPLADILTEYKRLIRVGETEIEFLVPERAYLELRA